MPKSKRLPIPEESRIKLLLWCERHCGFCGKQCTTNIEIHHVDNNPRNNDEDNLIPLCFDCHGELARYNPKHPKGMPYRENEIKSRREQIYEEYTLKYLRQVDIKISNFFHQISKDGKPVRRKEGDVSCTVRTLSSDIPVQLRLKLTPYHENKKLPLAHFGPHFTGKTLWNLNPGQAVLSHFPFPFTTQMKPFNFRIEVEWSIIDILKKEHKMLPFSYFWDTDKIDDWWYHPAIGSYHGEDSGQ
jgi:hypothetical protein